MEIGQLVEITFSQPLDLSGSKALVEIDVEFSSQNKDCNFEVLRPSNIHDWNNTVFVHFEHESSKSSDILTFQIGNNKLLNGNEEINCFIESIKDASKRKGKYKFKGSETLGRDNKFNLSSFENKEFNFYGDDEITRIF